ncbi:MAG: hypothetical protein D6795_15340, partial [Deltaproteobacteria bacterium]
PGDTPLGPSDVTVTNPDGQSATGSGLFEVLPDAGPLVVDYVILEDPATPGPGNGDGVANPGERLRVRLGLRNDGPDTATAGTAVISSTDTTNVSPGDYGPVAFSDVAGGSVVEVPFEVLVASSAAPNTVVPFDVEATPGNAETFTDTFKIEIFAPTTRFFDLLEVVIDDDQFAPSNGNNNGSIEPPPTDEVVEIRLRIRNRLPVTARNVTARIETADPFLTLLSDTVSFGDIAAGQVGLSTPFLITIDPATPFDHAAVSNAIFLADDLFASPTEAFTLILNPENPFIVNDGGDSAPPPASASPARQSGTVTLRAAVAAANADPQRNVIQIDPSVSSITLDAPVTFTGKGDTLNGG